MRARARALGRRLAEVLFPSRCAHCETPLHGAPNAWFCGPCWAAVGLSAGALCDRCGIPIPASHAVAGWCCADCIKRPPAFAAARVLGPYDGPLGAALRLLKYHGRTGLAPALAARLDPSALPAPFLGVDLVAPVPLHPRRLRERGFNQAGRLARAVAARLGVAVADDLLARHGAATSQVGLSRARRLENVRGVFRVPRPQRVAGRTVLLVDDVMTTGATAHACAAALVRAGARRVVVWAVARQGLS
ncbi:MAG: ComF family protein [Nitrospirae bacterium]|nr:ComF family protein [Nitrospirota bacterium]